MEYCPIWWWTGVVAHRTHTHTTKPQKPIHRQKHQVHNNKNFHKQIVSTGPRLLFPHPPTHTHTPKGPDHSVSQRVGRNPALGNRKIQQNRGKNCKNTKKMFCFIFLIHWLVTRNSPKGGSRKKFSRTGPRCYQKTKSLGNADIITNQTGCVTNKRPITFTTSDKQQNFPSDSTSVLKKDPIQPNLESNQTTPTLKKIYYSIYWYNYHYYNLMWWIL